MSSAIPIPPKHRLDLYGLSEDDFLALWHLLNGHCPMCMKPFTKTRPACIDHCHVTWTVRGLLCGSCNLELGYKHDDWSWFQNTADYLNYPPADQLWPGEPRRTKDAPPEELL
jgi:hypothetical protein